MKRENIFVGNIRICTHYSVYCIENIENFKDVEPDRIVKNKNGLNYYVHSKDTLYKENAILIKLNNGKYVDLDKLNSRLTNKKKFLLPTSTNNIYKLFVDESSLKPYYSKEEENNISIRQLKKQRKMSIKKPNSKYMN